MTAPRYIHSERINGSTFRLSVFVDQKGMEEFLRWLDGRGLTVCIPVVENGHTVTRTLNLDAELAADAERTHRNSWPLNETARAVERCAQVGVLG